MRRRSTGANYRLCTRAGDSLRSMAWIALRLRVLHTPTHRYPPVHDDHDDRPIGLSNTLVRKERGPIPWIWEGVVAQEAITLLSAPEKVGKTTLLSLLLDRRRAGGQLLGRTVYPGRTVVCSEENDDLWDLRQPPLDFGPNLT